MVPKDKGWGMSNLGYGKNPCFTTFVVCHLVVSSNLVNLFNASAGGWGVMAEWLRAFIAGENVGKEAINSSIFPTTPFSPWSVVFTSYCLLSRLVCSPRVEICLSSRWPVDSRAEVRLFPLTRRLESSRKNRVCFSRVFCCWVQYFPHA